MIRYSYQDSEGQRQTATLILEFVPPYLSLDTTITVTDYEKTPLRDKTKPRIWAIKFNRNRYPKDKTIITWDAHHLWGNPAWLGIVPDAFYNAYKAGTAYTPKTTTFGPIAGHYYTEGEEFMMWSDMNNASWFVIGIEGSAPVTAEIQLRLVISREEETINLSK